MDRLIQTDIAARRASKRRAGWLERYFARNTVRFIASGRRDPERYERFAVRRIDFPKRQHADQDFVWLCFPGLDAADSSDAPWWTVDRPGIIPQSGTAFVFCGPTGIAGYSPDQCLRCTGAVLQAARQIHEQFRDRPIGVFSFSAGTHLGFYVANQLGRMRLNPVDKFVAVAPGESIAYGIFSTWVTDELATALEGAGVTKEVYDRAIAATTQKNNLDHLPSGRDLMIYAGTRDTYIPIDAAGGTNDLVKRLADRGNEPTYLVRKGLDHVTLAFTLIVNQWLGLNPYRL